MTAPRENWEAKTRFTMNHWGFKMLDDLSMSDAGKVLFAAVNEVFTGVKPDTGDVHLDHTASNLVIKSDLLNTEE